MANTQPAIKVEDDQTIDFSYTAARPSRPVTTLPQAWRDNNLELVVKLASDLIEQRAGASAHGNVNLDVIREFSAGLRYRFLAYEAMGLAVLAVADAKRIFELTAKFGSDADVEVDDQLLPVLASSDATAMSADEIMHSETLTEPAMQVDTVATPSGLKRTAEETLGGTVLKRSKTGNRPLLRNKAGPASLPSEVITTIADFLPVPDRIKLANTCHNWRSNPDLWRSLEFVRIKNVSSSQGWLRDTLDACIAAIQTCQRRSHNRLSSVVLKGFLTQNGASSILDALLDSKASLKYLAIPTPAQQHCFKQLYRHCRNLAGVDIRVQTEQRESVSTGSSLFDCPKLPFKLKTFISTQAIDCGDIARHMAGLEVVHGVKFSRQKQLNFIDGLVQVAPTLIEWRDDPEDKWDNTSVVLGDNGTGQGQLPTQPILFPKLRKLSALWAEHFIECLFPALEEARFNAQRGPNSLSPGTHQNQSRIATVILKSPSLTKLDILMPNTSASSETRQIFNAIATLPELKELGLWSVSSNLSLVSLVDAHKSGADKDVCLILPELHTIRLCTTTVSSSSLDRELSELLLLRFFLQQGCNLGDAKIRSEAALLVNFSSTSYGHGMTKAQRKKAINASAAAAESSSYKGTFITTSDGLKREEFDRPVLQNLVVSRGMSKHLVESSNTLLKQLIGRVVEVDTSKKFGSHAQHGYRGVYY